MSFKVTILPSQHAFVVEEQQTVLDAALKAGLVIPYGCRNGACGSCKGKVLCGDTQLDSFYEKALTPEEQAEGKTLFCKTYAQSDLQIEVREVQAGGLIPTQKLPARVLRKETVAPDVMVVQVQLPANKPFEFLPGQYMQFLLKNGQKRSYSMARMATEQNVLEFHIRHMPGGLFTDALFEKTEPKVNEKDILRLEGPMGSFFLRNDSEKPIVFLASGTGFAPIQAILEQMEHEGNPRPVRVYWGARRPHDLYAHAWIEALAARRPEVQYLPVVSDALPEDQWQGRTGWVHQAVLNDLPNLSEYEVYACGAPIVIQSAQRDFIQEAFLPEECFYADAFTSEADQ